MGAMHIFTTYTMCRLIASVVTLQVLLVFGKTSDQQFEQEAPQALVDELHEDKLHSSFVHKIEKRQKDIKLYRQKLFLQREFQKHAMPTEERRNPEAMLTQELTNKAPKKKIVKKGSNKKDKKDSQKKDKKPNKKRDRPSNLIEELQKAGLHASFVKQLARRSKSIEEHQDELAIERTLHKLRKERHVARYLRLAKQLDDLKQGADSTKQQGAAHIAADKNRRKDNRSKLQQELMPKSMRKQMLRFVEEDKKPSHQHSGVHKLYSNHLVATFLGLVTALITFKL